MIMLTTKAEIDGKRAISSAGCRISRPNLPDAAVPQALRSCEMRASRVPSRFPWPMQMDMDGPDSQRMEQGRAPQTLKLTNHGGSDRVIAFYCFRLRVSS